MLNCWFVAAVASLTDPEEVFYAVCPPDQSFDPGNYCGMFRFNFWRFGEWVEVIIDDFLPTHNGKLRVLERPGRVLECIDGKGLCQVSGAAVFYLG